VALCGHKSVSVSGVDLPLPVLPFGRQAPIFLAVWRVTPAESWGHKARSNVEECGEKTKGAISRQNIGE